MKPKIWFQRVESAICQKRPITGYRGGSISLPLTSATSAGSSLTLQLKSIMATKAAELLSAYGELSTAPGRRRQAQTIETIASETSSGITGATTVEEAHEAIAAIAIADREVTSTTYGRVSRVEAIQGVILTLDTLVGGEDYDPGTYTAVDLTGGSGTGATADIVVGVGDDVTSVTLVFGGSGYNVGDILSADDADLGGLGGSGFSIRVASTTGPINA